ncbi:hypothetical protein L6452_17418 [Arctium lappa]|uniref:Uncharacterized protein n=1 Tax=Arctium lappa TaxID=4217 RepID=A0ACB9C379_ARCLA|nr:hypothetical protein L6452_17418 [Arctium lappa]
MILFIVECIRIGDKTIGSLLLVAFQTRNDAAKSSTAAFRNWRMGGPRFQKASVLGRKRKSVEETMMTTDEGGCDEHQEEYENQRKELMKAKREIEMMKNERKSKECEEALKSLRELQNKLMRKSMHVGSLGINLLSEWLDKIFDNLQHFISLFWQLL